MKLLEVNSISTSWSDHVYEIKCTEVHFLIKQVFLFSEFLLFIKMKKKVSPTQQLKFTKYYPITPSVLLLPIVEFDTSFLSCKSAAVMSEMGLSTVAQRKHFNEHTWQKECILKLRRCFSLNCMWPGECIFYFVNFTGCNFIQTSTTNATSDCCWCWVLK